MAESDINWPQFWAMLMQKSGLPLQDAKEPLTGFTGIQRTRSGNPATWMHMGVNLQGLEWLIPLLTPNQTPEAIMKLLSELPIPDEVRRQIEDAAIEFALQEERKNPGTFAKYPSVLEADVAAQSSSKNLIVRDDPMPWPQPLPGRR